MINKFRLPSIEGSGAPNQYIGDLLHTMETTSYPTCEPNFFNCW